MEENQKKLIILASLIFFGVLAYVFWSGYGEMKQQNAGELLPGAESEEELEAVIQNHPDTRAAASAKILLADLKAQTSPADAIEQLRDLIAKYPNHPAKPKAEVELGLLFIDQGKIEEAEASLTSVVDNPDASYVAPVAKIALADIAVEKGDKDRAKQLYNEVNDLTAEADAETVAKYSYFISVAQERLRTIDAAPPKKVKPAPEQKPENTADSQTADEENMDPATPDDTEAPAPNENEQIPAADDVQETEKELADQDKKPDDQQ